MSKLDLSKIHQFKFPESQYIKETTEKKQIYLHHTAGNSNGIAVFEFWKSNTDKIATCVAISGEPKKTSKYYDGLIVQGFPSKYWAYHLGLKKTIFHKFNLPYIALDKISIGIEICNWGWLTETDRGWETYVGTLVSESEVIELSKPFKGHKYFQKYTDAQIESVRQLLLYWNKIYDIPVKYLGDEIFDIDQRALKGEPGVFTHNSVRSDKTDIFPQPEMIQMLKSL